MTERKVLYHYTNAAGLLGVINSRAIWATESNSLNDPTEISFAAEAVLNALVQRHGPDPKSPVVRLASDLLRRAYIDPHSLTQYEEDRAYITSFSRTDDSLTLWRMYGGANGFCIGFDERRLLEWVSEEFPPNIDDDTVDEEEKQGRRENFHLEARVEEVEYGDAGLDQLIDEIDAMPATADTAYRIESDLRRIFRRLASVKHQSFADEREARVVVQRVGDFAPDPSVRAGTGGALVAFHKLFFPFEAVRSITGAPGADWPRTRRALQALLMDGGRGAWSEVELFESDLQFSW